MAESPSSPLIQVNRRSNQINDQEEIDWLGTFLRIDSATFLVARKFRATNGDRDVSTFKFCWTIFLFVWWTATLFVSIALIAIGASHECPGLDSLPSAMVIYGSFLMFGPLSFFAEKLMDFLTRKCTRDDLTEWRVNSALVGWFLIKAAVYITILVWMSIDGQELFGFYEKYITCDPVPTPDPFDPDSCQCDPTMYWFAFSTLIFMYPVYLFSLLYFLIVYVLFIYVHSTK